MSTLFDFVLWLDLVILIFFVLAVSSIPSVLVQRAGRPMAALTWILAMIALPPIGLILWWAFGRRHLARQRRKRQAASIVLTEKLQTLASDACPASQVPPSLLPLRRLPEDYRLAVFPPSCGNCVQLLNGASEAYPAMLKAIEEARHHIHLLFYIWNDDATGRRFLDALMKKAKQGVEVRLLCDAMGSPSVGGRTTRPLVEAGGQVSLFLPPRLVTGAPTLNFRNHRKILVADGKLGFTGGINVGDEYAGAWHDLAIRIEGPSVDQLQEVFADDWYFAAGQDLVDPVYFGRHQGQVLGPATCGLVASGPDCRHEQMQDVLFMAINEARERVYIVSPYFIPNPPIMAALRSAMFRGLDVRVMVPGRSDVRVTRWASRSFYPDLLEVGVRLFEYQAGILHAKAVLFDRSLSLVGSANINNRSFRLNFEASMMVGDPALNEALASLFEADMDSCREIRLEDVLNRPWRTQVIDGAAHLLSPVL